MINFLWMLWYMFACLSIIGTLFFAVVWVMVKAVNALTSWLIPWYHRVGWVVLMLFAVSLMFTVIFSFTRGIS